MQCSYQIFVYYELQFSFILYFLLGFRNCPYHNYLNFNSDMIICVQH